MNDLVGSLINECQEGLSRLAEHLQAAGPTPRSMPELIRAFLQLRQALGQVLTEAAAPAEGKTKRSWPRAQSRPGPAGERG
jgi:hypothetical protein